MHYLSIDSDNDIPPERIDSIIEHVGQVFGYKVDLVSHSDLGLGDEEADELRSIAVIQAAEIATIIDNVDSIQEELRSALEEAEDRASDLDDEIEEMISPSSRRPPIHFRLPDERTALTHKFLVGGRTVAKGYVTVGLYPDSTDVGEIFISMDPLTKDDRACESATEERVSDLYAFQKGILDQLALSVSIGLQRGIPLSVYTDKFISTRFPPEGHTSNKDIPRATSVLDYVFRWVGGMFIDTAKYMPRKLDRAEGQPNVDSHI